MHFLRSFTALYINYFPTPASHVPATNLQQFFCSRGNLMSTQLSGSCCNKLCTLWWTHSHSVEKHLKHTSLETASLIWIYQLHSSLDWRESKGGNGTLRVSFRKWCPRLLIWRICSSSLLIGKSKKWKWFDQIRNIGALGGRDWGNFLGPQP